MAKNDKRPQSELALAAEALDEELRKFESLTHALRRDPLNSQKSLERTAGMLREVADSDDRLAKLVHALVAAITTAREKQQQQAKQVHERALELQQRTEVLKELLLQYEVVGTEAIELNAVVQKLAAQRREAKTPEANREIIASIEELEERMGKAAESARALAEGADAKEFVDVSRQAEALRQQLLAAKNKMGLLKKGLQEI